MTLKFCRTAMLGGLSLVALTASHAFAQEAPAPQTSPAAASTDAEDGTGDQIVVTGSRIVRRDYNATSPIVTVGQAFLDSQAGGTFGVKLQQLPQVTPGSNELSGSGQPTGRATVDLRGLGANRTLVLADGRRLQPSTSSVIVDLNSIPSALVENIEVITGGASAIYGSDAIAGVVNLKLRHDFQGLELNGQYNLTELGDGREYFIDGLLGTNFADHRGNVVLGLSYLDRGNAYYSQRDFYREAFALGAPPWGSDLLPEGNFVPDAANLPTQQRVDEVFARYGIAPGSVARSNVLTFNNDAANTLVSQFMGLNYRGPFNDQMVLSPFNDSLAFNLGTLQLLTAPTERYNVYGAAHFDVTNNVTVYAQGMFTDYSSVTNYGAGLQTQGTTAVVPADNAFIPADLASILASRPDPTAPFSMRKLWTATGTSVTTYDNSIYQIVAGLRGKFGDSDWRWDLYGSHGRTKIDVTQASGSASFSRIQQLLTSRSVVGPDGALVNVPQFVPSGNGGNSLIPNPAYATAVNDGGRSLPGVNGGPAPCPEGLDIFGNAPLSESCSQFLQIHPTSVTRIGQTVVEGTVTGSPFSLPAGPVQVAIGADYRRNTYRFTPDPAAGDLVGSFGSEAVAGATTAKEVYGEVLLPVLRDVPAFKAFDVNLAYRYSKYLSGGVSTYKGDIDWTVIDAVRVRAGYQRAIRAPNVVEYFNPAVASPALLGGSGDPCNFDSAERAGANAARVRALCVAQGVPASIIDTYKSGFSGTQAIQQGNLDLKPEKADTYTAGVVLTPRFGSPLFQRLSLSVDYYKIDLSQAISTLSADLVFARCFNATGDNPDYSADNLYCRSILRNPAGGTPDQTLTPYFNLGGIRTDGIDVQLDWGFGLDALGLDSGWGRLDLNVVASRLMSFEVQASEGAPWVDYVGTTGFRVSGYDFASNNGTHPKWKANSSLTWSGDGGSLGLRWYYVGPMRDIVGGPGLEGYSRFDLFASVKVNDQLSLSGGVNNLFDKDPLKTFGGLPGNTDSGTYDPLGRRYFINARLRFR